MRRAAPLFILAIAVAAIVVNFVALPLPGPDGTTRRLETKLGLDLRGGLRIEYQVLPAEGKAPTRDDLNVMRQIIVNRIDKSGVAEPTGGAPGNDRIVVGMPLTLLRLTRHGKAAFDSYRRSMNGLLARTAPRP